MEKIILKKIETDDYITVSKLPSTDYVINPYIGCSHGCKYCYARFMKRFTNHSEEWGKFIDVKICYKPIKKDKLKGKAVFLSSVTDCYNQYEEEYKITRNILEQLKDVDCFVSISTKSKLILRDLDLLKQFKNLVVAMSINTTDEHFRKDMDNASSIKERFDTLKELHNNGIYTVLFMSPIFPYITDWQNIIEESKSFIDEYWFENLNLRGEYKKAILDYIKNNYFLYYDKYLEIYENNDKEYWTQLSNEIEKYCSEKKIKYVNYFYHEDIVKR